MTQDEQHTKVLYYGSELPPPAATRLQAGRLSLVFENGDLRYIRYRGREILRRVYVAVRDQNWTTVPSRLSNLRLEVEDSSFHATFEMEHKQGDIDFYWRGTVDGDEGGTIAYRMDGEVRQTFLRNRIGLCVLHPVRECAGQPCVIDHADGTHTTRETFPLRIAPHQPFKNIRRMSHEVMPGSWAQVAFEGDIFETEDQRNWSDASFKTYSTPLELPFPVEVKKGTKISQGVTLTLRRELPPTITTKAESDTLTFSLDPSPSVPLPRIGLSCASHNQPLSQEETERLKALNPAHLRVDLKLFESDYELALQRAAAEALALGASLELALFVSDGAAEELAQLVKRLDAVEPPVGSALVFHANEKSTTAAWVKLAREYLASRAAKIGGGTNVYFTELNRNPPPREALDLVCYSLNPQVHSVDNSSLVENLAAQAETIRSAREISGGLPIAVTPVTLKPRFNPNAPDAPSTQALSELPPQVDVRQMSLFGAAWTVGSLKYVCESAAYSATYFETTGWRGVMEREAGSPLPQAFRSPAGEVFPLYHVLADINDFAGGDVVLAQSSDPLSVDGWVVQKNGNVRAVLANMRGETRTVVVRNLAEQVQVKHLDETNVAEATADPAGFRAQPGRQTRTSSGGSLELELPPYGLIRIDSAEPAS